jgi:hypothetical protein
MAAVRKIQIHQRSHLIWIKASDANTKLFHLRVNARCRKNYIPVLQHGSITCTTQQAKAAALHQHFSSQLGSAPRRHCMLNWIAIGSPLRNLQDLDNDLTEAEIQAAVMQMSTEKVSGPDGYIGGGGGYKSCWNIIHADLVAALKQIFGLREEAWELLNSTNIALLPKKEIAHEVGDYSPISLMHSVAKLLGKVLANRLAPHLDHLVYNCQSAFIKGCIIQDIFSIFKALSSISSVANRQCYF